MYRLQVSGFGRQEMESEEVGMRIVEPDFYHTIPDYEDVEDIPFCIAVSPGVKMVRGISGLPWVLGNIWKRLCLKMCRYCWWCCCSWCCWRYQEVVENRRRLMHIIVGIIPRCC